MREMARRAQRAAEVAAAPDLIRFNLYGSGGASGQALFSRTRGVAVSAWNLPPLKGNSRYELWLLTRSTPVKVGTLVAETDGSARLVQPTPTVPRAVVGAMVTDESSDSAETPSGVQVLSSVVPAAPQPASEQQ